MEKLTPKALKLRDKMLKEYAEKYNAQGLKRLTKNKDTRHLFNALAQALSDKGVTE